MPHEARLRSRVYVLMCLGVAFSSARAQVVTDGTLGARTSLAGPAYSVTADLGAQAGNNLFHSFSQFSIANGQSATFSAPASVQNIIGRVTGGAQSSIDGVVRSSVSGASLWLLNPSGIIVGPSAAFDVSGSLHLSTASYLRFADGARFEATGSGNAVITSAAPAAFGFLGPPGPLRIAGSETSLGRIATTAGHSLTLTGGDISISNAALAAPAGRIEIAAMASAGEVALGADGAARVDAATRGTVTLTNMLAETNGTASRPAGSIGIRGGRIVVLDSALNAFNRASLPGGDTTVEATNHLLMTNSSISSVALGRGSANRIALSGPSIELRAASAVQALSFAGQAGDINITAQELTLAEAAQVSTASIQSGAAGNIAVTAERILLDHATIANDTGGTRNAGSTTVRAGTLTLSNDGAITTITQGAGSGGNLDVRAQTVEISGGRAVPGGAPDPVTGLTYAGFYSGIYSTSQGTASGAAGSVQIAADTVRVSDGGTISGVTIGSGNAGNITIQARLISLESGGLVHTSTSGAGNAGSIVIQASESIAASGALDTVKYAGFAPRGSNASGVVSKATGELNPLAPLLGNGGSVRLQAPEILLSAGAEVSTAAERNGAGGRIDILGSRLAMSGASVSAASSGTGNAGDIGIGPLQSFVMDNASVTTQARSADGGNITVRATDLIHLRGSRITTAVSSGFGSGGNIDIDPRFIVLNSSRIVADAFGGNGGNITIVADQFIRSPDSIVSASSQLGLSGTIVISSPAVDVSGTLADLQVSYVDAGALLTNPCAARLAGHASSLVLAGRGGVPFTGEGYLPSFGPLAAAYRRVAPQAAKTVLSCGAG